MAKKDRQSGSKKSADPAKSDATKKLSTQEYEAELARLQGELVKLQYWVKEKGLRVIVVFEGRDAAGKGGVIKRITQRLNPRVARVVALPAPTDREKTGWRQENPSPLVAAKKRSKRPEPASRPPGVRLSDLGRTTPPSASSRPAASPMS